MKTSVILICGSISTIAFAGGSWSVEHQMIDDVGKSISLYRTLSNGVLPTTWSQIFADKDYWARRTRILIENGLEPIQATYVFAPTNLAVIGHGRTGLVLIARSYPLNEDGRTGRYVIYTNPDDDLSGTRTDWIKEEEFQAMLGLSGTTLPVPDPADAAVAKAAVEERIAREQIEHQMIVAAAPKPTWDDIRAVWWWRIKSWFIVYTENGHSTGRPRPLSYFVGLGLLAAVIFGLRGKRT